MCVGRIRCTVCFVSPDSVGKHMSPVAAKGAENQVFKEFFGLSFVLWKGELLFTVSQTKDYSG